MSLKVFVFATKDTKAMSVAVENCVKYIHKLCYSAKLKNDRLFSIIYSVVFSEVENFHLGQNL